MSAKKLGCFAAGLFVALGLAFGGSLHAADGLGSAADATAAAPLVADALRADLDWH
jgi:hypothetical protein